ncbi:elongin-A isoform X2 [Callorhinchus milii]|uniref:elongin-A isoform X2 n=1 Tax=Callorhinchus milii TaxID=7868 RepID=UPI0004571A0A|nr:elongin-A isoform X2 [Callorhinchus milii]|eukprot:gi/632980284/ref/XP_007906949.1/ PREDICTED: transcription elongation factor B polypeptide 3 isoform X2 [Callorhinchus milii]
MAAEEVQEQVVKLQGRLSEAQEPRKLLKTLKRLNELPITVDTLADTGIGKTVNGFRKHDVVGEFAKNLVSKWKKLVPQEVERSNTEIEERDFSYSQGSSKKRREDTSPEEDNRQTFQGSHRERYDPTFEHNERHRQPLKDEKSFSYSCQLQNDSFSEEEERWTKSPPVEDSDGIECSDEELEESVPLSKNLHRSHRDHQSAGREKEHKSLHKQKQHTVIKGDERYKLPSLPPAHDKTHKSSSKEQHNHRERGELSSVSSSQKNPRPQPDEMLNDKKHKHRDSEKRKSDREETRSISDKTKEKSVSSKQKEQAESKKSRTTEKPQPVAVSKDPAKPRADDVFEEPTMSFESYLSYDQPQKKKKKINRPPVEKVKDIHQEKLKVSDKHSSKSVSRSSNSSSLKEPCPIEKEEKKSKRRARDDVPRVKAKKMMIDVVPVLPDIPLPLIQPNYRPLPSMDMTPLSPPKRKAASAMSEEDLGFTGRRFNSKMQVYSGSKTSAYLPKMMSLYDQCIRVLQNNVDSIHEVGGVPYEILEPVLERCTPEQLYRIEDCNPIFVEETDELWLRHCKRDFKNQDPQEYESWREMYLRLHDEREQKLRAITQSISSAHASKPKGRQAKLAFLNTEVKPPRDVRRRQEKHGTGTPIIVPPRVKVHSHSHTGSSSAGNRSFDGPSTSSSSSHASMASLTPPSSGGSYESRKPQVKKIAPMMAKTIKCFKNRFSRR